MMNRSACNERGLPMRLDINTCAHHRERGVIGSAIDEAVNEKIPRTDRIGTPPSDAALGVIPSRYPIMSTRKYATGGTPGRSFFSA